MSQKDIVKQIVYGMNTLTLPRTARLREIWHNNPEKWMTALEVQQIDSSYKNVSTSQIATDLRRLMQMGVLESRRAENNKKIILYKWNEVRFDELYFIARATYNTVFSKFLNQ